jgi:hypothetical protein
MLPVAGGLGDSLLAEKGSGGRSTMRASKSYDGRVRRFALGSVFGLAALLAVVTLGTPV